MKRAIAFALLAALLATPAAAQSGDAKADLAKLKPKDFPTGPIEYTVVYPAGGGMDVTARLLAKHVEKWSGDKIVVNNRTGGAGMVGHSYLATQAKPDGYTVGVLANLMWGDAMLRAQGRWSYTDLEPIGYLNSDPLSWVGPTDGPYKDMTVKQIVQAAKDKPNTVRAATVPGSMWDYILDQVEANTGAKFLRVPFQGGGAGINALAGGNVDIAQGFYSEFRGLAEAGKVRPHRRRGIGAHELHEGRADHQRGARRKRVSVDHHPLRGRAEGNACRSEGLSRRCRAGRHEGSGADRRIPEGRGLFRSEAHGCLAHGGQSQGLCRA